MNNFYHSNGPELVTPSQDFYYSDQELLVAIYRAAAKYRVAAAIEIEAPKAEQVEDGKEE